MKYKKILLNLITILLIPQFFLFSLETPIETPSYNHSSEYENVSAFDILYDNILDLIECLEEFDIDEKKYEKLIQVIIKLAEIGSGDDSNIENDISSLLINNPNSWKIADRNFLDHLKHFDFYQGDEFTHFMLCGSKGKFRKWLKKHKKEIIIASVFIGAAIVAIITNNAATAAVPATGAGVIAATKQDKKKKYKPEISNEDNISQNIVTKTLNPDLEAKKNNVSEIIQNKISEFNQVTNFDSNEFSNKMLEPDFCEKFKDVTKYLGAKIAHEIIEAASDVGSIANELKNEIDSISQTVLPKKIIDEITKDLPKENISFDEKVNILHEKIDSFFFVDNRNSYITSQKNKETFKELLGKNYQEEINCVLPPPGQVSKGSKKILKNIKNKCIDAKKSNKIIKPLGRGSTGRFVPKNLKEKLALEQVINNPFNEKSFKIKLSHGMTDPRWPKGQGWVKMGQTINGIEIHYVRNEITGVVDDFKFIKGNL